MKIAFVLHDFGLTGAPKLGLQIAAILARHHPVWLFVKQDGPLRSMVPARLFQDLVVTNTSHEIRHDPLGVRVDQAATSLRAIQPDLVYVNSIAAADWIGGAVRARCRSVLHVHEMRRQIYDLKRINVYSTADVVKADRVLAASPECLRDFQGVFGVDPRKVEDFGVCIDLTDIQDKATSNPPRAVRHDGEALSYIARSRDRKIVAMCGLAQQRKGADLFWDTARLTPEHDFLWIGPWNDPAAQKTNPALPLNARTPLDNLYWTNLTTNPYAAMTHVHLFALTAREDPNPLVVPEAIALGLPVATFAGTGGSHHWTNRYGLSLSGQPNPERLSAFIRRFFHLPVPTAAWTANQSFSAVASLEGKTTALMRKLEAEIHAPAMEG